MKYDVFISYRRDGGGEFARSIKAELELRGYSVFLDFDELKDGVFDERILEAIESSPVFLFILSNGSLDRCMQEGDWVRKEVEHAYRHNRHIIPVNKDGAFVGIPEELPDILAEVFSRNQYSDIMLGQLFGASIEKMVKERIAPVVRRPRKKLFSYILLASAAVLVCVISFIIFSKNAQARQAARDYVALVSYADSLLCCEDSIDVALHRIETAEDISESYADTRYSSLFDGSAEVSRRRLEHVKDSLFTRNKNCVEFYIARYRQDRKSEDKRMTLHYIDRALALKDDADLAAMRRILE